MKRSKRYQETLKKFDKSKKYSLPESLELLRSTAREGKNDSIELHIHLNMNEKEVKNGLSVPYKLPHMVSTVDVKIAVLASPAEQKDARAAGADFVGLDDIVKKIEDGWTEFDVLIASPSVMPQIAKLGKVLGPKGLMPNSKNETVTTEFKRVIDSFKAGKSSLSLDAGGNLHLKVGSSKMKDDDIVTNIHYILDIIQTQAKKQLPSGFKSIIIKSSMSPSIKLDLSSLSEPSKN